MLTINETPRQLTEKRNDFYAVICELNNIDKRYYISRNNEYFDTHTVKLKAFNFWDWLWNGHRELAIMDYDDIQRVIITVKMPTTIEFFKILGSFFTDKGLKVVVTDDTAKAKESC